MRDIVSPLMGLRSPFGGRVDRYKAAGFRPTLVADMTRDYYRSVSRQTFDDIFTHSRLGNATMVDSDGLLKWGPHNLLTYSEDFSNAAWKSGVNTTVTANAATAPDGTVTADRLELAALSGSYIGIDCSVIAGVSYTLAIWAKAVSGTSDFALYENSGGANLLLATETATTEWTLFEVEFSATNTDTTESAGIVGINNGNDSYASDILVWGAHLYRSDLGGMAPVPLDARVAGSTTYVPTTSTAKYLPRRHNHVYDASVAKWNLHNLLTYSEEASRQDLSFVGSVSDNVITAPDGASTADLVMGTTGASTNSYIIYVSGVDTSVEHTCAVWVKYYSGYNWLRITFDTAGTCSGWFDIQNGVVGTETNGSASITDAGDGWYLCEWTATNDSSTTILFGMTKSDGGTSAENSDGTSGLYIWGAHLYRTDLNGMEATGSPYPTYLATTGTAVEPTLSDVSWVDAGTLIETEARTNLITYSQDFTDASWTKVRASISASATTGPDGVSGSASKLLGSTDTNTHFAYAHVTSTGDRVVSIYAKAAELSWLILANTGFGTLTASFDLSSGSVGTITGFSSANMEDCGDGWYRCSALIPSATADGTFDMVVALGSGDNTYVFTGSASEGIYIYGAQFEEGSTPSSYCPSNGAASTRAADTSGLTIPAYSTTRTTGSELVTNGGFDSDLSGWTQTASGFSVSGGQLLLAAAAGGADTLSQVITTVVGKQYRVTYDLISTANVTVGELRIEVRDGATLIDYEDLTASTGEIIFVATTTTTTIQVRALATSDGDETATIDNISVKEAARIAPWPTPRVIGEELVTNGTFDSDVSGWTVLAGDFASVSGQGVLTYSGASATVSQQVAVTAGKVYKVTGQLVSATSASPRLKVGSSAGATDYAQLQAVGDIDIEIVATSSVISFYVQTLAAGNTVVDNISVKEIDPLVVAIQMQGRMTYADTDNSAELEFFRWSADANNELYARLQTNGSRTGRVLFGQLVAGVGDFSGSSDGAYSPGINVPFNIASYHGSTFINGAVGGAALTADTTPTALPDLSSTDLSVGYDFMGNIEQVRIWVGGITDVTSGNLLISEASS